jgi:hypothetical protein
MGDSLNEAIGRVVLAGSSIWSFIECKDLKYIRVAFGLYGVSGVIGVINYGK